jgi:hypothetical protein
MTYTRTTVLISADSTKFSVENGRVCGARTVTTSIWGGMQKMLQNNSFIVEGQTFTSEYILLAYRLCGLVVRVLGYRSGGPGSIPCTTRTKKSSGSGTGSTQPLEYNWGGTWKKSSGSCLENREYARRDPSRWPRGTLYTQKLAITSLTRGGRSVGIVRSRTQTVEFLYFVCEVGQNCVTMRSITCTLGQTYLEWSSQGQCDGQGI